MPERATTAREAWMADDFLDIVAHELRTPLASVLVNAAKRSEQGKPIRVEARGFVQLLGGRIWVDSEPGEGATFAFTLPASRGGGS